MVERVDIECNVCSGVTPWKAIQSVQYLLQAACVSVMQHKLELSTVIEGISFLYSRSPYALPIMVWLCSEIETGFWQGSSGY